MCLKTKALYLKNSLYNVCSLVLTSRLVFLLSFFKLCVASKNINGGHYLYQFLHVLKKGSLGLNVFRLLIGLLNNSSSMQFVVDTYSILDPILNKKNYGKTKCNPRKSMLNTSTMYFGSQVKLISCHHRTIEVLKKTFFSLEVEIGNIW